MHPSVRISAAYGSRSRCRVDLYDRRVDRLRPRTALPLRHGDEMVGVRDRARVKRSSNVTPLRWSSIFGRIEQRARKEAGRWPSDVRAGSPPRRACFERGRRDRVPIPAAGSCSGERRPRHRAWRAGSMHPDRTPRCGISRSRSTAATTLRSSDQLATYAPDGRALGVDMESTGRACSSGWPSTDIAAAVQFRESNQQPGAAGSVTGTHLDRTPCRPVPRPKHRSRSRRLARAGRPRHAREPCNRLNPKR